MAIIDPIRVKYTALGLGEEVELPPLWQWVQGIENTLLYVGGGGVRGGGGVKIPFSLLIV